MNEVFERPHKKLKEKESEKISSSKKAMYDEEQARMEKIKPARAKARRGK